MRVVVLAGPREEQRVTQLAGQGPDEALDNPAQLGRGVVLFLRSFVSGHLLDPVRRVAVGLGGRDRQPQPPADALPSIERLAPGDGQEPGAERRVPAEAPELAVCQDERLLRHVVSIRGRAKGGDGRAEDRLPVPHDQLPERVGVAGLRPADQVRVGVQVGGRFTRLQRLGCGHTVSRLSHRGGGWILRRVRPGIVNYAGLAPSYPYLGGDC